MTTEQWLLVLGVVVLLLASWFLWTLTRLRRLEARVDRAWIALDNQLRRRAALADELVRWYPDALGDDVADRLAAAAAEAQVLPSGDRELAENTLGHALEELPAELPGVPLALQNDLGGTVTRLGLARRFYNDAVRDTGALRQRRLTRLLRVHASRPLPRFFDIDDSLGSVIRSAGEAGQPSR